MLKKTLIASYVSLLVIMGAATVVEKYHGTDYAKTYVYGAWWFTALWAILAATAVCWIVRRRMRRWSLVTLHGALLLILAGALLTHLTGRQGMMHLYPGEKTATYVVADAEKTPITLPFEVRLDSFVTAYHSGTTSALDYRSHLTVTEANESRSVVVSMNNIFSAHGIRLYQSGYDPATGGCTLAVNSDPWGIPVTYTGYALLFISLLWMLADPKGTFRRLLHHPLVARPSMIMLVVLGFAFSSGAQAQRVLPDSLADKFGQLYVHHNGRICQMQTLALDFTKKLCGKRAFEGYSAEQVVTGFIFFGDDWSKAPLIRVKGKVRERLSLPSKVSFNDFFNPSHGYQLGPLVEEYFRGDTDKLHEEAMRYDDKLQLILQLREGKLLKVFPFYSKTDGLNWYSPTDKLPDDMEEERKQYISNIFSYLYQDALSGNYDRMGETLDKMLRYQKTYGGTSIPSDTKSKAERLYNAIPFATILFMVNLFMAVVSLFVRKFSVFVLGLSWCALTLCIALRWIVSGNVPMSNGYETMLLSAWLIATISLLMCRRFPIVLTFGFLMSGFFLLVSHIGQMDPQITYVMPVLNSPLLSIHVSIIMMAYALLSMTFACGVTGLLLKKHTDYLHVLSQIFLYPALAALAIGIFTGAVWANISWGTYWSWDPKEVWALITLMVYAVAVHSSSLRWMRSARHYHLYMVAAFLTLLMTYFGVNYFLGGMHSYA